jgi:hypothetical protein
MFEDDVTVPAGWYPDPMGLPQLRWWNNHAWTELTTEARPPLVMQTPTRLAYADEELPTRRQQREQRERDEQYAHLATDEDDARDAAAARAPLTVTLKQIDPPLLDEEHPEADDAIGLDRGGAPDAEPRGFDPRSFDPRPAAAPTTAPDAEPVAQPETVADRLDSESFDSLFQPRSATTAVSGSTAQNAHPRASSADQGDRGGYRPRSGPRLPIYTAPVWIIALLPLLLLVLNLLLLLGFGSSLTGWVTPGIWAGSYVLAVVLAIADRASLGRSGYEHRASWAWALLTGPVYLIARSTSLAKVGPLGFAPVLVWAALGILQAGSVLVVPGLIISALPSVFTAQAEQSIASDASIIGANLDVTCAKALPVLVGQTFDCAAKSTSGTAYNVSVTLQRTNGWIDWHVDDWGIYTLSR